MLPSKERVNTTLFKELSNSRNSLSVFNNIGTFKFIKTDDKKISVVIGAKILKKAVSRNKLKRRIYSIFSKKDLRIKGILYISKKAPTMSFEEIKQSINDLFAKIEKNTK